LRGGIASRGTYIGYGGEKVDEDGNHILLTVTAEQKIVTH